MTKSKPKRILVVEDEANVRESMIEVLKQEQIDADGAADGAEALRLLESQPYDAMTLDLMLPVLDGWAVLAEMRHQDMQVPVLVVTARQGMEASARARGAADVLVKPFDVERMLERIERLLEDDEVLDAPEWEPPHLKVLQGGKK